MFVFQIGTVRFKGRSIDSGSIEAGYLWVLFKFKRRHPFVIAVFRSARNDEPIWLQRKQRIFLVGAHKNLLSDFAKDSRTLWTDLNSSCNWLLSIKMG